VKIKCVDTNEIVHSYGEYLTTHHWQRVRQLAFQKSGGFCVCCKRLLSNSFICHHRTYRRVGRERIRITPYNKNCIVRFFQKVLKDDVIAVCRHCHNGESKNHIKLHEFVRVPEWAKIERENG